MTFWDEQPPERVLQALKDALAELSEMEQVLAKALQYPQFKDTPRPPSGYPADEDDFVTGEHTAVSLAMEASRKLNETLVSVDRTKRQIQPEGAPNHWDDHRIWETLNGWLAGHPGHWFKLTYFRGMWIATFRSYEDGRVIDTSGSGYNLQVAVLDLFERVGVKMWPGPTAPVSE